VLAGAEKRAGLFKVNVIWRTDMHTRDFLVGGELGEGAIGAFETERFRGGATALSGAEEAAADVNPEAAKRFEMRPADESESNDGDGMFHASGSPVEIYWNKTNPHFTPRREKPSAKSGNGNHEISPLGMIDPRGVD